MSKTGSVRIIGGDFRGRKLPVLNIEGLRPTSDRVRETLFNWLQFDIVNASCLDVFAGSGSLGFESLSRGAKSVVMLESDRSNINQLEKNKALLEADNLNIYQVDSMQWLNTNNNNQSFDLVFIDPPFKQGLMATVIERLFNEQRVHKDSMLYLEQEKNLEWPGFPENWSCYKEKTTSQVRYGLFKYQNVK